MPLYPSCLAGEGAVDLVLFQVSCGRLRAGGCSHPGPQAGPRDLTIPKQSPYCLFFNVFYKFVLQLSYMLRYHWLFTLFPRRSARCSTCTQGDVGLAPTYLTSIFEMPNSLRLSFISNVASPSLELSYLYKFLMSFVLKDDFFPVHLSLIIWLLAQSRTEKVEEKVPTLF